VIFGYHLKRKAIWSSVKFFKIKNGSNKPPFLEIVSTIILGLDNNPSDWDQQV
jgi:hypothetical protein